MDAGTINAAAAAAIHADEDGAAVANKKTGTVNVGTTSGPDSDDTGINTNVATVTLNAGTGASCVLSAITVAASGDTKVGALPSVYKDGAYSDVWYTDSAKATAFSGTTVTSATTLYSSYYTPDVTLNTAAISGVTAPVRGAAPVTSLAGTSEYTTAIAWSPAVNGTFAASTVYTATITLTPKTGYTTTGVAANFFTVSGATATNSADSGVITAVFPATAAASSNDGSPRSGGGTTTTTAPTTTVSGMTATTTVTPKVSGGVRRERHAERDAPDQRRVRREQRRHDDPARLYAGPLLRRCRRADDLRPDRLRQL